MTASDMGKSKGRGVAVIPFVNFHLQPSNVICPEYSAEILFQLEANAGFKLYGASYHALVGLEALPVFESSCWGAILCGTLASFRVFLLIPFNKKSNCNTRQRWLVFYYPPLTYSTTS